MARTVPSQVVALIDRLFGDRRNLDKPDMHIGRLITLVAILELLKDVPRELITLPPDDYSTYVSAVAAIRTTVDIWQTRGSTTRLSPLPGYGHVSPVAQVRDLLALCPDEF